MQVIIPATIVVPAVKFIINAFFSGNACISKNSFQFAQIESFSFRQFIYLLRENGGFCIAVPVYRNNYGLGFLLAPCPFQNYIFCLHGLCSRNRDTVPCPTTEYICFAICSCYCCSLLIGTIYFIGFPFRNTRQHFGQCSIKVFRTRPFIRYCICILRVVQFQCQNIGRVSIRSFCRQCYFLTVYSARIICIICIAIIG